MNSVNFSGSILTCDSTDTMSGLIRLEFATLSTLASSKRPSSIRSAENSLSARSSALVVEDSVATILSKLLLSLRYRVGCGGDAGCSPPVDGWA